MTIAMIAERQEWIQALSHMEHDWYHTWDCHHLPSEKEIGEAVLIYYRRDEIHLALPLLLRSINDQDKDATSVYGYAGLIGSEGVTSHDVSTFIDLAEVELNKLGVVSLFSRMHPLYCQLQQKLPAELLELAGHTLAIDLNTAEELQRKGIRSNNRREIRKLSESGASCCHDEKYLDDFIKIYEQTMQRLSASEQYFFSTEYYQALLDADDFETRIYVVLNDQAQVMCAGLFIFTGSIVQYHLSGTQAEFARQAPVKLMLEQVRIDAREQGYRYFHLGGGVGAAQDSLFNFKRGFSKNIFKFCLLKWIVNADRYAQLVAHRAESNSGFDQNSSYFPAYRQ